jgi:hypothetical protein
LSDDDTEKALKLQSDARIRARAQSQALRQLAKIYPQLYAQLYRDARERLMREKNATERNER